MRDNPNRLNRIRLQCWICILTALCLLSLTTRPLSAAQQLEPNDDSPLSVQIKIDKTKALVAERIQVEIIVLAPAGVKVKFPAITEQLGVLDIIKVNDMLDLPDTDGRKSVRRIELESLDTGEFEIPIMQIGYADRRGTSPIEGVHSTDRQPITIGSTLEGAEDPKEFRDIKPVMFMPEPAEPNAGWSLIGLAVAGGFLVIATAAIILVRRRSLNRSPEQWAHQAIAELETSNAFFDGNGDQVYVGITNIIRTFIERQLEISAPRLTTNEFLDEVQNDQRLSEKLRSSLREFLTSADLVKFAGMVPDRNNMKSVVVQARKLVEQSVEQVVQPTEYSKTKEVV